MGMQRVIWEIDVDADGSVEAAVIALRMMRDPNSTALCFSVKTRLPGTGQHMSREQQVDLVNYAKCDACKLIFAVPEDEGPDTIRDLVKRLDPGGMVPACECGDCGALAYPVSKML